MVSNKELLAKRLQQNTQKHQHAQKEHINDVKELRRNVQITDIQASPNQPRKLFNQQDIEDLAASIEEIGLLQPIAVRRINDKYELIAGERRLKAHQFLNKNTIEVIIIDASDEEVALLTLAENLKREDLTDYEIYVGLTSLDEELKKNKQKLAKSLGMNREDMYKYLSFEKLPGELIEDLEKQPSLLARTAATAVKKFLSDHEENHEYAKAALFEAWSKLLNKEVEQTKLASLAEKIFKSRETKEVIQTSIVHKIEYGGKVAGNIKFDHNTLKVSLKIGQFDDQNLQELETFLKRMLEK
ncbi:ParB/RepB/Spo0J family partition protein (plasmid) [Acinetobacter baumannii]|uniref:Partitioning protein ParB / Stage0 sporulation protein J n=2 Tax=Acinetobacter TaxID=469 RepID=A0A125S0R1_ACIBA|nr:MULTISPECIES: ParB/RepB/Spo0J family partition protein [Acinetobacter]AGC70744.1 partitioning protein ParB / Stage0 sporulation protein J [Acinetobacter sp. M131]AMD83597.1 partitioning protein ParB / Stage0 sporulation protein J [Acinetobacter baumannii]AVN12754.1 ParB/RepB/Spo0J family partition protein [Acinetobacter baumannii]AVZ84389.1 ParB/RepB/Spo0J family partition protein [Acinetobacter sp. WCHA45]EKV2268576.1 ParB/RepB/Spo0J family partition protein [Acinetobacter baumannii]